MPLVLIGNAGGPEDVEFWEVQLGIPSDPVERAKWARDLESVIAFGDEAEKSPISQSVIANWILEFEGYRIGINDPSLRLIEALKQSLEKPEESSKLSGVEDVDMGIRKPRFRTSLEALNNWTGGGGFGLMVIGGTAKAGKSMFAIGTAIEAARQGWRVIYNNGELDRNEMLQAVMRYSQGPISHLVKERMHIVSPDVGYTPWNAVERVGDCIQIGDDRILVVLDSINALVELSEETIGHWTAHGAWRNLAVRSVKKTEGQVAFILVSELNKDGNYHGGHLDYKADLALRIQKVKDSDELVEIDITHSRGTKAGSLGRFLRDWPTGRFEK